MRLNRAERDVYALTITTSPALSGTWEASFDSGATWVAGAQVDGQWQWLVAGPDFNATDVGMDAADTQATITETLAPLLRVKDNPILDVENGPWITLA